jgi:hypothetical protein
MLPSEYFKRHSYIALDVDEEPTVDVVNKIYHGAKNSNPHDHGPSWAIYGPSTRRDGDD